MTGGNIISTGRRIVTELNDADNLVLETLFDEIVANDPDTVPDVKLYARAAYNINGFIFCDQQTPGLCIDCVKDSEGYWVGSA